MTLAFSVFAGEMPARLWENLLVSNWGFTALSASVLAVVVGGSLGSSNAAASLGVDGRQAVQPTVSMTSSEASAVAVSGPLACRGKRLWRRPPGKRVHITVHLGDQHATLTGVTIRRSSSSGTNSWLRHARVVVRGGGDVIRYRTPRDPTYQFRAKHPQQMAQVGTKQLHGVVCLVRFHAGEPAVGLVGDSPVFMGGAPRQVLLASSAHRRQIVPGDFRRYSMHTASPEPLLVTGDMRFFGVGIADFDSGFPLRVFTVSNGHLRNVSADHPDRIEHDASNWLQQFRHPRHGPRLGALAAWAADMCTLGHQTRAFHKIDRLAAAHRLRRRFSPWKTDAAIARYLKHFLIRTGYAT
jgi:hypothetical protein